MVSVRVFLYIHMMKLYLIITLFVNGIGLTLPNSEQHASYEVYLFLSDECVISQYYMPQINELYKEFANDSIHFIGIFPNFSSKPDKIESFKLRFDIPYQLKTDYYKKVCKKLNAEITPEVVILRNEEIIYKGRIDNAYLRIGQRRRVVDQHELREALEQIRNEGQCHVKNEQAVGCFINFADNLSQN